MEKEIELRSFKIQIRELEDGEKKLTGTPIVYNKDSEDMGFIERIAPGAATEALKKSDVRLLYGHNSDSLLPIARQSSGTLRATETKKGVDIEADPPKKNQFVDALIESIERGDVGEMSFGFTIKEDAWKDLDKDKPTRTIKKFDRLYDFSYVVFPAYGDTTASTDVRVALRSLDAAREGKKEEKAPPFILVSDSTPENKGEVKIKVEVNGVEFVQRQKTEASQVVTPLPAKARNGSDSTADSVAKNNPEVNDRDFWKGQKVSKPKKE